MTWNRCSHLERLLECLERQEFDCFELLVVDNGSVDGTAEVIGERFPWVRYVRLQTNFGLITARNIGIMNVSGTYILFIDDDVLISNPRLLRSACEFLSEHQDVSIIGLNVIECSEEIGHHPFVAESETVAGHSYCYCDLFDGGASVFRRGIFEQLGYFDETLWFGSEETDFALRALAAGFRIVRCSNLIVYHFGATSPLKKLSWRFYNTLVVQFRHLPLPDVLILGAWQFLAWGRESLRNGWFLLYLKTCGRLLFHLPFVWLKQRNCVTRQNLSIWYYLRTHRSFDFVEISTSQMGILDYLRDRLLVRQNGFYN